MKAIIYMPALNEEKDIKEVIKSLPKKLEGIDEIEVLVVNDGSTDNTEQYAKEAGATVVTHSVNRGVGGAFQSALKYCLDNDVDILVSVDADRQFDVSEIPQMISHLLENKADMVTGNRFENGQPENMSTTKYWGNKQMSRLISIISGKYFRDVSCGFRAYNKEAMLNLNLFGEFTYTQETILDMVYKGLRVIEHPVKVTYYPSRKSRVAGSIVKYAFRTSRIIFKTLMDYKPMMLFTVLALASFILGILLEIVLYIAFAGVLFMVVGLLLFIVGLVGSMIQRNRMNQERILYELKKRR